MRFVVIGAGYAGRRVLARLPDAIGFSRSAPTRAASPLRNLDLDNAAAGPLALADRYRLLYTIPPASGNSGDNGDRRLARLLQLLDPLPERFIYISTSGVYGDCGGQLVNEDRPVNPHSERARRRAAAEELLNEWSSRCEVTLVTLRVPAIYGPARLGIDRIGNGTPLIAEADAGPANRIHVDDLAACCVAALEGESPQGIYNTGDGDYRTSTWFSLCVARLAGLEPPPQVPRSIAEQTFSSGRLSFLRESRRLDNNRMRAELLPRLQYADPEDGIRASLSEQRKLQ